MAILEESIKLLLLERIVAQSGHFPVFGLKLCYYVCGKFDKQVSHTYIRKLLNDLVDEGIIRKGFTNSGRIHYFVREIKELI